jgi:hypothetical protein
MTPTRKNASNSSSLIARYSMSTTAVWRLCRRGAPELPAEPLPKP